MPFQPPQRLKTTEYLPSLELFVEIKQVPFSPRDRCVLAQARERVLSELNLESH